MRNAIVTAPLVLSGLMLGLAAAANARDFDERVAAEEGGTLVVVLDAGSLQIEGGADDEVRVEASSSGIGGRGMKFSLESDGDRVLLRGDRSGVGGWLGALRVRVRVRVPETFSVDARTSGGSIDVEELQGDVEVDTSGGGLRLSDIEGSVRGKTSGGSIHVSEIEGPVEVETSGGSIRISEVQGEVDAETSGGSLRIHDVEGRVRARTSGGSISVRFEGSPGGEIETSGGGIEVELPEGEGVDLEARTSGGRIELDRDLEVSGQVEAHEVRGELYGGGEALRVQTSGGGIRIRAR